jgi:hypothetical protein
MSKKIIIVIIIIIAAGLGYWIYQSSPVSQEIKERICLISGGQVTTSLCCNLTGDFPNSCLIGACGCSPTNSHQVKKCDCGEGKCFNGNICVPL